MKTFEDRIGGAFWYAFIIFLIPSIPHMATVFRVWEPNYGIEPSNFAGWFENIFWWVVSAAGATVIDGGIIYLSHSISKEAQQSHPNNWYVALLGVCVLTLTGFSWQMNVWYALMNESAAQASLGAAYTSKIFNQITSSSVMPYMVSALPVLGIMFTVMAGRLKQMQHRATVKPMSDQEHRDELRRIRQEQELTALRKGTGLAGKLAEAKVALGELTKSEDQRDKRTQEALDYLRNARELLDPDQQKLAVKTLATYLKVNRNEALVYLIQARSLLVNEDNTSQEEEETSPAIIEDKLQKTLDFLEENPEDITNEMLAEHLGLERAASAGFWRIKALEILRQNPDFGKRKMDRSTGPLSSDNVEEIDQKNETNPSGNNGVSDQESGENFALDEDLIPLLSKYPKLAQLLSRKATTVRLEEVANALECTMKLLRNRVADGMIQRTKNPDIVYIETVISWAKEELLGNGKGKVIRMKTTRNSQRKTGEKQQANA